MSTIIFNRGSEWRKWDLQVHAPKGKLYDGYKTTDSSDPLDKFCDEIEKSDVEVIGITDYFSFESFHSFSERFSKKYPSSKKVFFFNLELRLNESVNQELEEVNVHLVFNPDSLKSVPKFLNHLKVVKTGPDQTPIMCSELKGSEFESAVVTREAVDTAFKNAFGEAERNDHFLVITAANNDGLRPKRGKKRKEGICDEIDKFSDAFFGGSQNVDYYLNTKRYEDKKLEAIAKPVVSCSDSHSFDDIDKFLGKRYQAEVSTEEKGVIEKDITWIKADLTYEGLKQIIYEPKSGERVYIGSVEPDQKDGYKVIRKIRFNKSNDFPEEIEFNHNLCSIIGSRSAGKSALLAYIAHSIDPTGVEKLIKGPGQGEAYHWNEIDLDYSIEWADGRTNEESPGSVVYLPQDYLFQNSNNPEEIKSKIEPVLFKVFPKFKSEYTKTNTAIEALNNQIGEQVIAWFAASEVIKTTDLQLKDLGDKKAVERQQTDISNKIELLSKKNKLSEADLKKYQEISQEISGLINRNKEIDSEIEVISTTSTTDNFFSSAKITLTPTHLGLPLKLQENIKLILESTQKELLESANKEVLEYEKILKAEKVENDKSLITINETNKDLIENHQKNDELEGLVKSRNAQTELLKKISDIETSRGAQEVALRTCERLIDEAISSRNSLIQTLSTLIQTSDQSQPTGIKFGLECGLDKNEVQKLSDGLNLKEKTDFVEKGELKVNEVRNNTTKFLSDVYSGKQKVKSDSDKRGVAARALRLTEKILFTAEMEGDKIGGFSEPTMTPGKRALFALRLILEESEDTWPLLIDQPEDDLDSRSIYLEVVPFLKSKKKERQIIMVSHNANLVIGADSEQLIIANRNGNDRKNADGKQFNYLTGSLEQTRDYDETCEDTLGSQGIREHACSILDGGKIAFEIRANRYHIK